MIWTCRIILVLFLAFNAKAHKEGHEQGPVAKNKNGAKYLLVEVPDEHLRNVLRLNKKESRSNHENNQNLHVVPGKVVSLHHPPQGRPRHPKGMARHPHPQRPQRPMMQRPQWLRPQMMRPQMVRPQIVRPQMVRPQITKHGQQITRHQMMSGLAMGRSVPPVDPEFAKKYYPNMAWTPTLLWDPELNRPGATYPGPKIVWQPNIMWLKKPKNRGYTMHKPCLLFGENGKCLKKPRYDMWDIKVPNGMGRVPRVRGMGLMGGNGPKPMGRKPGNPGGLQPVMSDNGDIEYIDYSDVDLGQDYEYVPLDPIEDLEYDESGRSLPREAFLE